MKADVLIMGSGGHAQVLAATLLECGANVVSIVDVNMARIGTRIFDIEIIDESEAFKRFANAPIVVVNGIGSVADVAPRKRVHERCVALGWEVASVTHPSATVSRYAHVDTAVQILARAVIQPEARVGVGVIVNTGAIVEHHSSVGAHTHVATGAVVAGGAMIGPDSHIGANATVLQGVRLGPKTIVGAGAVVVHDHPGGATLIGVPAKARASKE